MRGPESTSMSNQRVYHSINSTLNMLQQFTALIVACLCLVHLTDASNLSNFFNKVAGLEKQARQNGLTKKADIALYVTKEM